MLYVKVIQSSKHYHSNITSAFNVSSLQSYKLNVSVNSGQGVVTPSFGEYVEGTAVTIAAVPDSGWEFGHWEGAWEGTENPLTITMNSDKTIGAIFIEIQLPTPTPINADNVALETLNTFLTYAVNGNIDGMWTIVHPDSKNQYRDSYDFKWMNGVYSDDAGGSLLVSYEIVDAIDLPVWNNYSNVIEAQVNLHYMESAFTSIGEAVVGEDIIPEEHDKTWTAHLIMVDNSWHVICDSTNPLKWLWME